MKPQKLEPMFAGLAGSFFPHPDAAVQPCSNRSSVQITKYDTLLRGTIRRKKAAFVRFFADILAHWSQELSFSVRMARLAYEKQLLEQQNRAYQAEFDRMRQSEQQVRALRHDLKNHLAVLEAYAAGGQTEELVQYLRRLDQHLAQPGFVHTGNLELDSILNYKLDRAKQAGAKLELDVHLPKGFRANAFDLNVILSNLLDNAVEGLETSRSKELSLSLAVDRGVFFVKIVNSYDGVVLQTAGPDGPVYRSRKDGQGHGLGLGIVRRAVDKYHGALCIDSTGTIFSVEAILYLEG